MRRPVYRTSQRATSRRIARTLVSVSDMSGRVTLPRNPMTDYVIKPLYANTWDAFTRLVERHNGVFGGCWCTWFHTFHAEKTFTAEGNRALKERLVERGSRTRCARVRR